MIIGLRSLGKGSLPKLMGTIRDHQGLFGAQYGLVEPIRPC